VPSEKRQRKRENAAAKAEAERAAQRRSTNRRRAIIGGGAVLAVVAIIALLVSQSTGGSKKKSASATAPTTAAPGASSTSGAPAKPARYGTTPCPSPTGSSPKATSFSAPFQECIDPAKTYTATMETDSGTMTIALDPKAAPVAVNNFVSLARSHYYDGLTFHRVIPGFVDQGGDPKGDGSGGPGYQFADELPAKGAYKVGSLAMANSGPNTNGSQFFIIVGDQGVALPPQYSLFGQVTAGLDAAKKIEADGTDAGTPKVVHKINRVTITES